MTPEETEKILAALDRYMYAKEKLTETIVKTGKLSTNLANEVNEFHDKLTIEWMRSKIRETIAAIENSSPH